MDLRCPGCGNILLTFAMPQEFMFIPGLGSAPCVVNAPANNRVVTPTVKAGIKLLGANMRLKDAAPIYLRSRRGRDLAESTYPRAQKYVKRLVEYFGEMRLSEITSDHIREYQEERLNQEISATCINHEIAHLRAILDRVGLWENLERDYRRLRERKSNVGRVLSTDQEKRLFKAAQSKEEWRVAYLVALLAANTIMNPSEIFGLRLADVDLENKLIHVRQGKNEYRPRTVPLIPDALKAAKLLLARAKGLGCFREDHYVLPYRGRHGLNWNPAQRARGCRSAWRSLTVSVDMRGLRVKDLRHHGITIMDEHGTSGTVIKKIAGHAPNSQMLEEYSHPRIAAKRRALMVLHKKRA